MRKHVLVVCEGGRGVEMVVEFIQAVVSTTPEEASCETVANVEAMDKRLAQGGVDIVVLLSATMINTARRVREAYKYTQVVVLVADISVPEILILPKPISARAFKEIVLGVLS